MIAAAIGRLRAAGKGIARPARWGHDFKLFEIIIRLRDGDRLTQFAAAPDHISALRLLKTKPKACDSMQILNHGLVGDWIAARRGVAC
jgi:hypothetical protein